MNNACDPFQYSLAVAMDVLWQQFAINTSDFSYIVCRWGYEPFQVFKKMGIPGPPPTPFLGNLVTLMTRVSVRSGPIRDKRALRSALTTYAVKVSLDSCIMLVPLAGPS